MAIYEYYCFSCRATYEARRSMAQVAEVYICPHCAVEAAPTISLFSAVKGGDGVALASDLSYSCDASGTACAADGGTCLCE